MPHARLATTLLLSLTSTLALPWSPAASARELLEDQAAASTPQSESGGPNAYFEPNVGQADPVVRYLARLGGDAVYVLDDEIVLDLVVEDYLVIEDEIENELGGGAVALGATQGVCPGPKSEAAVRRHAVRLSHPEAARFELEPAGKLPSTSNYFIGGDPTAWHTGVPHYEALRARGVFPGVDLVLRAREGQLALLADAATGADLSGVELRVDGADGLEGIAERLAIRPDDGGRATPHIEPSFGIDEKRPAALPLPAIFALSVSGAGNEFTQALAVDSTGATYLAGGTTSSGYATTAGSYSPVFNRGADVLVTKLSPTGALVFSTFIGGTQYEYAKGIAVDAYGHVYLSGNTSSDDYPVTFMAPDTSWNGFSDAFVSKLRNDGAWLTYSTYLGAAGDDYGTSVAVDPSGYACVAGVTYSPSFPTTSSAVDRSRNGPTDVFVAKINPGGTLFNYLTLLGGERDDWPGDIAVNPEGSAYLTGGTSSRDFPRTAGVWGPLGSRSDVFVTRLDPGGTSLKFSTSFGGTLGDDGTGIAVDVDGSAYVTGTTASGTFPTSATAYDTSLFGSTDAFALKLSVDGRTMFYSTFLGGLTNEIGGDIALAPDGAAYVVGRTRSSDFPTSADGYDRVYDNGYDSFVTEVLVDGTGIGYSSFVGGNSDEEYPRVGLDSSRNVVVGGTTFGSGFLPAAIGARGGRDGFVVKLRTR